MIFMYFARGFSFEFNWTDIICGLNRMAEKYFKP